MTDYKKFEFKEYHKIKEEENDVDVLKYLNSILLREKSGFIESYLLQEKIDILMRLEDNGQLKVVAEEAIEKYPDNASLLYSYAKALHIELMKLDRSEEDAILQSLTNVEIAYKNAEEHFDVQRFEVLRNNFNNAKIDLPLTLSNIDVYFNRKTEIMGKIHEVQLLRQNYNLYLSNIQQNENLEKIREDFNNSKIQHFEMLGLFSAIIALVVANVSAFSKLNFQEIILTNIFVVFSFIVLLAFTNNMIGITNDKKQQDLLLGFLFFMGFVLCFMIYFTL